MLKTKRFTSTALLIIGQISFAFVSISPAQAALVTATGTNSTACDQSVSNSAGITAARSGQDCIVTFTNTTEATWTVPLGVTSVSAIVVGGGGGGGDSADWQTGGGGGAGGFFSHSSILVSETIAIKVGAAGTGSVSNGQGTSGGTSYLGSLKVGGGGGGNGVTYLGGLRAGAGVGGADFVSSGNGGGARSRNAGTGNEITGGLAGAYSASGISFQGNTYIGLQGVAGGNAQSDSGSGGLGGKIALATSRTSSISGSSIEYSKVSDFLPWGNVSSSTGTKTPGSGGSPNYGYGTDPAAYGGDGAAGIVIIRYTLASAILAPTFTGTIYKGTLESVTVTVNIPGKVRFYIDGKRIPGCLAVSTSGSAPSITATCTWKPAVTGNRDVHATLTPSDGTTSAVTSGKTLLPVRKRVNIR